MHLPALDFGKAFSYRAVAEEDQNIAPMEEPNSAVAASLAMLVLLLESVCQSSVTTNVVGALIVARSAALITVAWPYKGS